MGEYSKYHRYHESGEGANVNNVENFGQPVYSLYTSTRFFSLDHHIDVTDEQEQIIYQATSGIFSILDKTYVRRATGEQIAYIERQLFSFHERHYVMMSNGLQFELSNELFHLIRDITNIEGLGWQLRGNILGLNFELYDQTGEVIAVIGQKMLSLHDKYCVDIYKPEYEEIVIAILITLQHMIRDRENSGNSSSNSASSD